MAILNIAVTLVCLVAFAIEVLAFTIYYVLRKRRDRIAFVRNFKKGKCAIIYVVAIPLYWIGIVHQKLQTSAEVNLFNEVFTAIHKVINLVVLKYEVSSVELLMSELPIYAVAIYACYFLVLLNAGLFTMSFVGQYIWGAVGEAHRRVCKKDYLMLFGYNESNIQIYRSDKARAKLIVAPMTGEQEDFLYQENIYYSSIKDYGIRVKSFIAMAKHAGREHIAIINTGNDETNITICRQFITVLKDYKGSDKDELFLRVRIYVFGDAKYQTIYDDIVSDAYGCIHFVNKYQKIAIDFINEYPLAHFLDERQVDYKTSLIKKDVNINVIMLGFGKTAQQIFLTSVANNQFLRRALKEENGKLVEDLDAEPELKRVKYHIFDKAEAKNNKNLNHSYYRYKNECLKQCLKENSDEFKHELGERAREYLPLPKVPAREYFERLDINDTGFYEKIRSVISQGENDKSFVIIAFGSDLENIDMAQKLIEKRREWEKPELIIFVKARAFHKSDTLIEEENCYFFGYERDVVYDIDQIMGDDIYKMAKMRNEIYDIEYYITNENPEPSAEQLKELKREANVKWHKGLSPMLRESSIYSCLSIRSKLNLFGLDYVKEGKNDKKGLTYDEYIETYSQGKDVPQLRTDVDVMGKSVCKYDLDFMPHSLRTYLGIHEHQRWNSFMISKGIIPSTLDQIYNEKQANGKYTNGKRYDARRHGNITTFGGLVGFRRLLAFRKSEKPFTSYEDIMSTPQENEAAYDVIKYDYQLLDDVYWLLTTNGFKIIKK